MITMTIYEVTTRAHNKCFIHTTQATSEDLIRKQDQFKDKEIIAITPLKKIELGKISLGKSGVIA